MMKEYYYSASENGFMPADMKAVYELAGNFPGDSILVDQSTYEQFTELPPDGKMRGSIDGFPAWVDIPPPTQEELTAESELIKNSLRMTADAEIAWRQDAVDAGIATDEETAALAAWKKYRVLLMRVDTAKPVWPTPPVTV